MMIAAGDPIKARQIYFGSTVVEATAAAIHLKSSRRMEEFNRQRLFQVINNSLGGKYEIDSSLLPQERTKRGKLSKKELMKNWIKMAGLTRDEIPDAAKRILKGD